jgi:hypothetical protein
MGGANALRSTKAVAAYSASSLAMAADQSAGLVTQRKPTPTVSRSTECFLVGSQRPGHHFAQELDKRTDLGTEVLPRWIQYIGRQLVQLVAR